VVTSPSSSSPIHPAGVLRQHPTLGGNGGCIWQTVLVEAITSSGLGVDLDVDLGQRCTRVAVSNLVVAVFVCGKTGKGG